MGTYWGYRAAQAVAERLTPRAAYRLAAWCADGQFARARRQREAVCNNLAILLGRSPEDAITTASEVFRHFAWYLVEFLTIHRVRHPMVAVEGQEHLRQAQQAGRGVIILTAHLGNWEVGAVLLRRMGYPISAVALPHADARLEALFNEQRRRCGVAATPLSPDAARWSLARLRQGHLLGLLGDQDFAGDGLTMRIGGGCLTVPKGPAVLSARSRAPIVPTVLIREGVWNFRLRHEPPLWPDRDGQPSSAVPRLMGAYAEALQQWLMRTPQQWVMFQPVMR